MKKLQLVKQKLTYKKIKTSVKTGNSLVKALM